ncbi:T-cell surface antigen CD2 [Oreochromis niloticus]|uniref:T-cell surface antigen CD2 n=1 Tax=Oreochromis niloticus TaxID=8128 RepID=UPI0006741489|nr:T-cell surface antigen CD2 [Oreochromis niloticus]
MEAAVGLLLMFGVSHGVETHCDGRQNGTQCYGALGGSVDIQLMDNTSEINRYQLLKSSLKILDVRNNTVISNTIRERAHFPSNGTFRINKLNRTDGGNYTLQTFDSDGKSSGEQILQLFIEAPVSSVLLVSECLSQGERRVSCSSEGGDSPQYSWTLDGRTLTDAELLSGNNKTNIITLKQNVSGRLVCSVRNNISNVSKEERIYTCGFIFINCTPVNGTQLSGWVYEANNTLCIKPTTVPKQTATAIVSNKNPTKIKPFNQTVSSDNPWYITYLPLIGGVLSALLILLVVGVAGACEHIIKQKTKPTEQRAEEDDQEVTYADVIITKCQRKDAEQRAEAEVEYGQIKFSSNRR